MLDNSHPKISRFVSLVGHMGNDPEENSALGFLNTIIGLVGLISRQISFYSYFLPCF